MSGSAVIKLTGVTRGWDGRNVLSNVNLTVNRGETLLITGPNGGGKTTLLRLMLKLIKPSAGTVAYLDSNGSVTRRLKIGYLPQKSHIDSKFPITVDEVVESGLLALDLPRNQRRRLVDRQLDQLDLNAKRNDSIGTLSGGQLQRALMARALVSDPEIVVFDEPLSYLDNTNEQRVRDILLQLSGNKTIIAVTHSLAIFNDLAPRTIYVDHQNYTTITLSDFK